MHITKKLMMVIFMTLTFMLFLTMHTNEASAHATLEKQTPAENNIVQSQPETIQLEFNEPVYTDYSKITLYDDKGHKIDTLRPKESGKSQILNFDASEVEKGTHQVSWETVSLDGHEVEGQYYFSVGKKTADAIDTSGSFYTDAFFWFGLVRFILQASLLVLTGLYIVNLFMARQKAPTYHIIPHHRSAIILLMMTAFLAAIVYLMTLPEEVVTSILTLDFTVWIQFPFIISMTSLIVVLGLFTLKNMESIWYKMMPLFIFISLAISGHVWTQSVPLYSIILRTIHLIGIATWLGSFAYLITYLFTKHRHSYVLIIKDVLLKTNMSAVVLIAVTGFLMSIDVTSLSTMITSSTTYSGLWFAKIGLTIVMVILGAMQTFWAMRQKRRINKPLLYIEIIVGLFLILAGVIMSQIQIPL
ncbi:copper resistance protein CopC [Staphylococcus cornubiensis]|uniref:copper resistance CopC/CopD family protein n=1 Tax=Staphylococcus cornubiensis TaxID=1986155 RepID=UPI000A38C186|nr:copper resistance protein CopC [Staphylococcus cornubiensis]